MNFKERYQYNPKTDLLGKGGFSKVYKAFDSLLQRHVALKIFSSEASEKYNLVNEIRRVINLDHPNLCRYYDVAFLEHTNALGDEENIQVGVMEYLDGGDVKNYIKSNSEHLDKLLKDILAALSYLHANGIIHRDLKPQNILIKQTPTGPIAKITDFGISKTLNSDQHTSSSVLLGSIEYMAPEQFNPEKYGINGKINTNVDLWSFGCLTYELVTGESVFGNRSGNTRQEEVMSKILTGDIVLKIGQLSDPYRQIVERCLVKNADQRARNAKELIKLFAEKDCDVGSFNETQIIRTTPNQIRETVPIEYDGIKEAKLTKRKKNLPIIVISIAALVLICLLFIFNRNAPKIVLTEAKTPLVDSASKQKNDIAATLNNKNDVNESAQTRVPNASQSSNTKKTEGLDNVTSENNNISSKPSTETVNKTPNNQNQSTEVIFLKPEILGIYRIASSDHRRKFLSLNGSASVVMVGLNEVQISGSIIAEIELLDKEDQPYTQTFSASFKTPNIQILPAADRVRCLASGSLKTEGPFNSRSGTINEILFIFDDFIELHSPTFTYFQMYKIHFER